MMKGMMKGECGPEKLNHLRAAKLTRIVVP
jgi:hypothetical protein